MYAPKHHYHREHPRLRGTWNPRRSHAATQFPEGSLSPEQVATAYGFTKGQCAGIPTLKIGIGSLGGGINAQDIKNACAAWGMPPPNLTILAVGGAVDDPSDQDSTVENILDVLIVAFMWWWQAQSPADITLCIGPNIAGGMALVTTTLVDAGCKVINWSWGGPASGTDPIERAGLSAAIARGTEAGVTFCAASGDNSIDDDTGAPTTDFPCSDPNVLAVGGTYLELGPGGSILLEAAWGDGRAGDEGGGGGFDPLVPQPAWQNGIVSGDKRGAPDVSANGDPNSGWQISANGSWTVVGGTSAASPCWAALIAVAKSMYGQLGGLLTPLLYARRARACRDITTGSNGLPAAPGWDPATGLGSPNGPALTDSLVMAAP